MFLNAGTYEYTISGIGNYKGELTGEVVLEKGTILRFQEPSQIFVYNRAFQAPEVKVLDQTGIAIDADELILTYHVWSDGLNDYVEREVTFLDFVHPVKIKIKASVNPNKDNYTGSCEMLFEIKRKSLQEILGGSIVDGLFPDVEFGNTDIEQDVEIKFDDYELVEGEDYEIKFENNKDKGTVDVVITGKGDYEGSVDSSFEILEKPIEDIETQYGTLSDLVIVKEYTGSQVSLVNSDFNNLILYGDGYLVAGTDFIYEYYDDVRIEKGDYRVKLTGLGNYCKSVDITMRISELDFTTALKVVQIENQTYTSKEIKPDLIFKLNNIETELFENIDYLISYQNNINVGTATITIIGTGYYTGEYQTTFEIIPLELTSDKIQSEYLNRFVYSAKDKNPSLVIRQNVEEDLSYELIKNIDFTQKIYLDANNNTIFEPGIDVLLQGNIRNANNYLLVLDGIGNYSGQLALPIEVEKLDLLQAISTEIVKLSGIENFYEFTGSQIRPEIVFTSSEEDITINEFEIIYGENKFVSTGGSITLKAQLDSNLSGEYEISFEILKANLEIAVELKDKTKKFFKGDKLPELIIIDNKGVSGEISYEETENILKLGKNAYKWIFMPEDTDNFNYVRGSILIEAEKNSSSIFILIIGIIIVIIMLILLIIIIILKKKKKEQNENIENLIKLEEIESKKKKNQK